MPEPLIARRECSRCDPPYNDYLLYRPEPVAPPGLVLDQSAVSVHRYRCERCGHVAHWAAPVPLAQDGTAGSSLDALLP